MEDIIPELLKCPSLKGLFKIYIEEGLQENPDELIKELSNQIQYNPLLSVELMGKKLVDLIELYVENTNAKLIPAYK